MRSTLQRLLGRLAGALGPRSTQASPERLATHALRSLDEYRAFVAHHGAGSWDLETALASAHPDSAFVVPGFCWNCQTEVGFLMDYRYSQDLGDRRIPNWRERLDCPRCGMNNRQRAAVQIAAEALGLRPNARVYVTEQTTRVYQQLRQRYAHLVGSEYLGDGYAPGSVNAAGIRHEDLTRLSFANGSMDAVLTFDVLEHVPDYRSALAECGRVLAPGGGMLFSIPFVQDEAVSRPRATIGPDGTLTHVLPPIYHGDPVRPEEGVLCYHDFGWDVLEATRRAGFRDAAALAYRSPRFGYYGGLQLLFAAWKA